MEKLIVRLSLFAALFLVAAGCGEGKAVHDEKDDYFVQAMAVVNTDRPKAIELLTKAVEVKPTAWTYYWRGLTYAREGDDAKASDDVQAGFAIDASNRNLKWLEAQLAMPAGKRTLDKEPTESK